MQRKRQSNDVTGSHGSISNMIAAAVVVVISGGNGVMTHQGTQKVDQIAASVAEIGQSVHLIQYRVEQLEKTDGSRQRQ